jgi:putative transposase
MERDILKKPPRTLRRRRYPWGTLNNELVHHRRYETREQARREITEYIEVCYNRQRRHSRLGNRAPAALAQPWARQQSTA